MTGRVGNRLGAIGRLALSEDIANVTLHGVDADNQCFGNHWVAAASCYQAQHFQFPLSYAVWQ